MTKRHYGLDLFRFFGAFLVVAGHLTLGLAYEPITNVFGYFTSPMFWMGVLVIPVPIFIMISGYFGLSRPMREDETNRTRKSFINVIRMYLFWIVVYVIANNVINGGAFTEGGLLGDIIFGIFNPVGFAYEAFPLLQQGKFVVQTAPLWYLFSFAGLILMTPMLKGFMTSGNIKVIRMTMALLFIGITVWNSVNLYSTLAGEMGGMPLLAKYLGKSSLLDINRYGYSISFYYLLGGWIRVDDGFANLIKRIPNWLLGILTFGSILLAMLHTMFESLLWLGFPPVNSGFGVYGSGYESILIMPAAFFIFVIFNRLDDVIKEDSKLGKFIAKNSGKTLGIYLIHVFVIGILHNILGLSNVNTFLLGFTNPLVSGVVYFIYAVIIYVTSYLIVTLLKKIPLIRRVI